MSRQHVVIIGTGFGGMTAAKELEGEDVDVTVIDKHNYHTFLPLLYQVATSGLNPADVAYPARGLFRRKRRVRFRQGLVTGVDWERREVQVLDEPSVPFDHLIIAAGARANYFGVPGAEQHSYPLYSLPDSLRVRNALLMLFEAANSCRDLIDAGALNIVVVGGGPTGIEIAGSIAELIAEVLEADFHDLDVSVARVVLVEQGPALLAPFDPALQEYARAELERKGVEVRLSTPVREIGPDYVVLGDEGDFVPTRMVVWGAGNQAAGLAGALGVELGRGGRIATDSECRIPGRAGAYAVGDIAAIPDGTGGALPGLAQVAIQSGRHAARQILASRTGEPVPPFRYHDKGMMATIGRKAAVAQLTNGTKLTGQPAWAAWLGLHLVYLVGMRNRVSVTMNWAWSYLTWDRGPRLILETPRIRPARSEGPYVATGAHGDTGAMPVARVERVSRTVA
jgi:NADH dehydrogenase